MVFLLHCLCVFSYNNKDELIFHQKHKYLLHWVENIKRHCFLDIFSISASDVIDRSDELLPCSVPPAKHLHHHRPPWTTTPDVHPLSSSSQWDPPSRSTAQDGATGVGHQHPDDEDCLLLVYLYWRRWLHSGRRMQRSFRQGKQHSGAHVSRVVSCTSTNSFH